MKKASSKKPESQPSGKRAESRALRAEVRLPAPVAKAVQVKHLASPPRYQRRERIHPRRILPRVREGKEREFHSATRPLVFHSPLAKATVVRAATDDLTLVTNTELTGPGQQQLASNVDEPSVAVNNRVVLYT